MDISVVVCTRNRANYLPQMLQSIQELKSDGIHWEVIFVNNGSSDNTHQLLEEFVSSSSISAKLILESKVGLSNARNAGWKAASGTIVSFTDDDCYPDSEWLTKIYRAMYEKNVDYVGGRVLLYDQNDAPITIQTSEVPLLLRKSSHIESGHIIGANFSCKATVLTAVDGFDSRLGAGSRLNAGEDTDLLIRASLQGFEGYYDPAIVVYHHHRRRLDKDVRKLYAGYARGRGALSMKTLLESKARQLYLKNWYWRMCSLARKGKFADCFHEVRGAFEFIMITNKGLPSRRVLMKIARLPKIFF